MPLAGNSTIPAAQNRHQNLTCVCGYDLRGLAVDGRCPECGRLVSHMRIAADVLPLVKRWQRRFALGAVGVGISLALWVGAALLATARSYLFRTQMMILEPMIGPHAWPALRLLHHMEPALLLAATAICIFALGLLSMALAPLRLRGWQWRLSIQVALLFSVFVDLITVFWQPSYFDIWYPFEKAAPYNALAAYATWADAAVIFFCGLLLASAAVGARRMLTGLQIAFLFTLTAAASVVAEGFARNGFFGPSRRWWYIGPLSLVVFAGCNVGCCVLLMRFATSRTWSQNRWWAWAGFPRDPDQCTEE